MLFLEFIELLTSTWLSWARCVLMGHTLCAMSASLAARGSHAVLRSVLLKAEDLRLDLIASVVLTRSILCGVLLSHSQMLPLSIGGWACCRQWSVSSPCSIALMLCENGRSWHACTCSSNGTWWLWDYIWVDGNVTVWSYGGIQTLLIVNDPYAIWSCQVLDINTITSALLVEVMLVSLEHHMNFL